MVEKCNKEEQEKKKKNQRTNRIDERWKRDVEGECGIYRRLEK